MVVVSKGLNLHPESPIDVQGDDGLVVFELPRRKSLGVRTRWPILNFPLDPLDLNASNFEQEAPLRRPAGTPETSSSPPRSIVSTRAAILLIKKKISLILCRPSSYPTDQHAPQFPLDALPGLHDAPIRADVHALPGPRQALDVAAGLAEDDLLQARHVHPYPPRRFAHQAHPGQDRLALPVLQAQPQPSARDVVTRDRLDRVARVRRARMRQEFVRRRGFGPAADDGRDEAAVLEGEHETQVELGVGDRRQPQPGPRGVLEV